MKSKFNITILVLFLIAILLFIFKSHIGTFIWKMKHETTNPVIWNEIIVSFPKTMVYRKDASLIQFISWKHPNEFIYLRKMNLNQIERANIVEFLEKKKLLIIEDEEIVFQGMKSYFISYKDDTDNTYNELICMPLKDACIHYEGENSNSQNSRQLIESMDFEMQ